LIGHALMMALAVAVIAHGAAVLAFWRRVAWLRDTIRKPSVLPSGASLFFGTAASFYIWSDRAWRVGDVSLERRVVAMRITTVALIGLIAIRTLVRW